MTTGIVSLLMLAVALPAPSGQPGAAMESLVGKYHATESGLPAGVLEVRRPLTPSGWYEMVLSLGHPDAMQRIIWQLKPIQGTERVRVIRRESDPELLEREAEAYAVGSSLVISSWLVTRTGERLEVRDTVTYENSRDVTLRSMIWPPGAPAPVELRLLKASRIE